MEVEVDSGRSRHTVFRTKYEIQDFLLKLRSNIITASNFFTTYSTLVYIHISSAIEAKV